MQERTLPKPTHAAVSTAVRDWAFPLPPADDPRCSVRAVLDRVADKWTALVITILNDGPRGYADLRRSATGISDKMLAQTLHKLERAGLVDRTVHTGKPLRVTYRLTALGETIVPPLAALRSWAELYGGYVVAHQAVFDESVVLADET